jgi:hypothetical protein
VKKRQEDEQNQKIGYETTDRVETLIKTAGKHESFEGGRGSGGGRS